MPEQVWPADKVERRPVESLLPYARNARTHSAQQVAQIAASIEHWGWTNPVLVDEAGGIIAGHGRVLAAKKLGIAEVPVMVASGWSDAQKRAYVLADNKLALNAGWDEELLALELGELRDEFDISLIGFSDDELANLLLDKTAGLTDPDEVPAVPVKPVTRRGVIVKRWQAFTGQKATLDGDGRTFEQIDEERYDARKDAAGCYDVAIEDKRKRLEAAGG